MYSRELCNSCDALLIVVGIKEKVFLISLLSYPDHSAHVLARCLPHLHLRTSRVTQRSAATSSKRMLNLIKRVHEIQPLNLVDFSD